MNRFFKATVLVGLMLCARSANAQYVPPGLPAAAPNAIRIDAGKLDVQGDVTLQEKTAADETRPTKPGAIAIRAPQFMGRAVEFQPDGHGNVTFSAMAPVRIEKGAFLGLNATHAPAVLREQLKLKAGLVVDAVEPNSPADVAGLKRLDVVEKLDDQWLINPAQLAGLVRMQKPGDVVTLTILHKGDRQTLKAKLSEREMPVADDDSLPGLPGLPGLPSLPYGIWHANVGDMGGPPDVALWRQPGPNGPGLMIRATKKIEGAANSSDGDAAYEDKAIMLRLNRNDGHTVLTATDKSGKTIFEGPIDTPQDRAKLPQEVRQRMEKLEKLRADVESTESRRDAEKESLEREVQVRRLEAEKEELERKIQDTRVEAEQERDRARAAQQDKK